MSIQPLRDEEIVAALGALHAWDYHNQKLIREFRFKDFRQAVAFMVRLAFEAEAANHHPEITNVYNRVTISLTTHDAGHQVTQKDIDLAGEIDRIAQGII